MATSQLERTSGSLVGRELECAAIDRPLEAATRGESSCLLFRGEAGTGKTALLRHAAQRGSARRVLRTTGVEVEADLAFAGLYGLLRPIVANLDELPATQAEALAGALGLAPSVGSDRLLVSAATLEPARRGRRRGSAPVPDRRRAVPGHRVGGGARIQRPPARCRACGDAVRRPRG